MSKVLCVGDVSRCIREDGSCSVFSFSVWIVWGRGEGGGCVCVCVFFTLYSIFKCFVLYFLRLGMSSPSFTVDGRGRSGS